MQAVPSFPQDEGFFARMVESSASLITVHDGHRIVFASPSLTRILGYALDDLVGQSALHIIHPDHADVVTDAAATCRAGNTARVEVQGLHADGTWRWLDIAGRSLPDVSATGHQYVVFSTRDVTDRHVLVDTLTVRDTQLRELIRTERHYRRLVEVANEGILWVDGNAVVTFANARMSELIGYEPSELVGTALVDLVDPDEIDDATRRLAWVRRHGGSRHERRYLHKDGSKVWVSISTAPVHDDDGTFLGTVGLVTDLTEQRAVEQARHESELEVQRLSMLAEHVRLEAELERALRFESMGRLAGGVAHDFNNLLGVMRNYLRVLSAQLPDDSEARGDAGQIDAAIERAAHLTQELLVFGDRDDATDDEFDPDELIDEVVGYTRETLGSTIDVVHVRATSPQNVRMPRSHLDRSLLNLFLNAKDAMPNGGTLSITTSTQPLQGHAFVEILISDTGNGMEPAVVASASDPFFTTKAPEIGTGLGLAIVRSTVEHAGGNVRITSDIGLGTTVRLRIPAIE